MRPPPACDTHLARSDDRVLVIELEEPRINGVLVRALDLPERVTLPVRLVLDARGNLVRPSDDAKIMSSDTSARTKSQQTRNRASDREVYLVGSMGSVPVAIRASVDSLMVLRCRRPRRKLIDADPVPPTTDGDTCCLRAARGGVAVALAAGVNWSME